MHILLYLPNTDCLQQIEDNVGRLNMTMVGKTILKNSRCPNGSHFYDILVEYSSSEFYYGIINIIYVRKDKI
jgi:hypothetical protein